MHFLPGKHHSIKTKVIVVTKKEPIGWGMILLITLLVGAVAALAYWITRKQEESKTNGTSPGPGTSGNPGPDPGTSSSSPSDNSLGIVGGMMGLACIGAIVVFLQKGNSTDRIAGEEASTLAIAANVVLDNKEIKKLANKAREQGKSESKRERVMKRLENPTVLSRFGGAIKRAAGLKSDQEKLYDINGVTEFEGDPFMDAQDNSGGANQDPDGLEQGSNKTVDLNA
jgi:hypothetical protein